MFKIDNPKNFHFQMKIRAEKVDKSHHVVCPCQSTTKKGKQGMQLSSIKGHYERPKDGKETLHTRWVANLKLAMRNTEAVIGITEVNGYWKHKYLFNTKRMAVFVFFPREQPNPCVLTYTITPSIPVDLIPLPPLVPTFLNEVAKTSEIVSDTLEPQEGNLDAFLLVSSARQTLMQWNDDATSSSGESLHSLQPLELPELQRSETTSVEEPDEEQEDDIPTQPNCSTTEEKPVSATGQTNDSIAHEKKASVEESGKQIDWKTAFKTAVQKDLDSPAAHPLAHTPRNFGIQERFCGIATREPIYKLEEHDA